jgi:hypothetical protein
LLGKAASGLRAVPGRRPEGDPRLPLKAPQRDLPNVTAQSHMWDLIESR